jgi:hypothetical protein
MAHSPHRLETPRLRRRSRPFEYERQGAVGRPASDAELSLPEALAHELNNPRHLQRDPARLKTSWPGAA